MKNIVEKEKKLKDNLKKLREINIQDNEELNKVAILKDQKNQLEIEKKQITTSLQSLEEENLKLRSQINELKKDYETSKRKENQFNEKIDELNQETDNLLVKNICYHVKMVKKNI